jgi:hypothetical protein
MTELICFGNLKNNKLKKNLTWKGVVSRLKGKKICGLHNLLTDSRLRISNFQKVTTNYAYLGSNPVIYENKCEKKFNFKYRNSEILRNDYVDYKPFNDKLLFVW